MRQLIISMMVCSAFVVNAQSNLLVSADEKAKQYAQKMENLFDLNEKQRNELYRLRFELSLAVNLAKNKLESNPIKLEKKLFEEQIRFQVGIKKTLDKQQYNVWTEHKEVQLKKELFPSEIQQANVAEFEFQ